MAAGVVRAAEGVEVDHPRRRELEDDRGDAEEHDRDREDRRDRPFRLPWCDGQLVDEDRHECRSEHTAEDEVVDDVRRGVREVERVCGCSLSEHCRGEQQPDQPGHPRDDRRSRGRIHGARRPTDGRLGAVRGGGRRAWVGHVVPVVDVAWRRRRVRIVDRKPQAERTSSATAESAIATPDTAVERTETIRRSSSNPPVAE